MSDHLAIGLTTGFMGSLTTFSGWNQKMVELSSRDHWVFAVAGIVFGKSVCANSYPVETIWYNFSAEDG